MTLADVQSTADTRGIALDEVGICGLRYPVSISNTDRAKQESVATFALSVGLSAEHRGSHLSRFLEVLDTDTRELAPATIPVMLRALQDRLESDVARMNVTFPFFVRRSAPVTGASALVDYQCGIVASLAGQDLDLQLEAKVPVTSVCPCSKAISDYGAHNQRGYLTVQVRPALGHCQVSALWFEDLIEAAEASASSPVYPILKRTDERHVTMIGYDHPVFVEDMVRIVTDRLRSNASVKSFSVEAVNDESIHNHGAFARVTWPPSSDRNDGQW